MMTAAQKKLAEITLEFEQLTARISQIDQQVNTLQESRNKLFTHGLELRGAVKALQEVVEAETNKEAE